MKAPIHYLVSSDKSAWTGDYASDGLPARPSGPWIDKKHRLLTYYANLFATGMKNLWQSRVYLELFSGPGKCFVRNTRTEGDGSPLKVIQHEFNKFIFTEMSAPAAEALATRLEGFENSKHAEIWCGDCREAIDHLKIPTGSLT